LITFGNIGAGLIAIHFIVHGDYFTAIVLAWIAGGLDIADGKVARKYNLSTEFGIQVDSYADFISFVVMPSFLLYYAITAESSGVTQLILGLVFIFYIISGLRRLIEFNMNDLWMRDTGPAFVINEKGKKSAVNFNFNGWGEDQDYKLDARVADFVAEKAGVKSTRSNLVLEGGCFELDGQGTAIMTESCILNDNRNPNKGKAEVESELKELLGLEKIIWLNGIKGKDITDGHTDFYARFARPGVVVVSRDTDKSSYDYKITRENIEILKSSTDAKGSSFDIIILDTPWDINTRFGTNDFAAGYVGYYVCNEAIIMQKFGDKNADNAAKQTLAKVFPKRRIEQIAIDGIASGGGSIHCATQQEPKV